MFDFTNFKVEPLKRLDRNVEEKECGDKEPHFAHNHYTINNVKLFCPGAGWLGGTGEDVFYD